MSDKKAFHEQVAESLIEQLKAGTAPWQKPWRGGEAYLPSNAASGHRYRGINVLQLLAHAHARGYTDNRWMTYKQAQALGAQVRKGERGVTVEFWQFYENQQKFDEQGRPVLDAQGKPVMERAKLERPRAFFSRVFNVAQIDGLELPPPPKHTWNPSERASAILTASGANIEHSPGDRAFYRPSTDTITMPLPTQFPTADGYYATALHELGHWTGHESRLDRDLAHPFGSEGYAREELRAEIASMILGSELGIGHDPGQHAAYVQSWIKVLENDPKEVFRAAADAEKIHRYVLALEQQQELSQDQAQTQEQVQPVEQEQVQAQQQPEISDEDMQVARQLRQFRQEMPWPPSRSAIKMPGLEGGGRGGTGEVWASDWTDQARVYAVKYGTDADGFIRSRQCHASEQPDAFAVCAAGESFNEDKKIASFPDEAQAQAFAHRLNVIDAHATLDPQQQTEKFARLAASQPEQTQEQNMAARKRTEERIWLDVPFIEKNEVKALGGRWDRQAKSWYIGPNGDREKLARWIKQEGTAVEQRPQIESAEREYLAVPYDDRAQAKALGAKWDKQAKSWYIGPDGDREKLARWLPENVPQQQSPAISPREEFAEAMRSCGLIVSGEHPIMDGQKHRVAVEGGKNGALDGFYVVHMDGRPAGRIINNKTGADLKWKSAGHALSPEESARIKAESAQKLAMRKAEHKKLQDAAAQRVQQQAKNLHAPTTPTAYIQAKGIQIHPGVLTDGQTTYIPGLNSAGEHRTTQYIQADGTKRFAKDAQKSGCFHPVGGMDALASAPVLVICEGYATAATLAEGCGHATAAALDCGNLMAVARSLHEKFPDKPIVIAGDNDYRQEMAHGHNPGVEKARAAAAAVGGAAIFPPEPSSREAGPYISDFNDAWAHKLITHEGMARQVSVAAEHWQSRNIRAGLEAITVKPQQEQAAERTNEQSAEMRERRERVQKQVQKQRDRAGVSRGR